MSSATLNEARERIYQEFVDGWGVTSAYTFDNEDFSPPVGTQWVRLAVRHLASLQESLGGVGARKFTRSGSVFVQVFVPLDEGVDGADNLLRVARGIFEGKHLHPEGLRFQAGIVTEVGPDQDWYQANLELPFNYTETK